MKMGLLLVCTTVVSERGVLASSLQVQVVNAM
jgi:hypothetical protein